METFLPFFVVLFASIISASLFRRMHLPWVVALIVAGIVIGPYGMNILHENETVSFIGDMGLVFLMFMVGLETKLSSFRKFKKSVVSLVLLNGVIPFVVGYSVGALFSYSPAISFLIGIIFVSSSIAIVAPVLEMNNIIKTRLGQSMIASFISLDVLSLVLLSVYLQVKNPIANVPLVLFYPLLITSLIALRFVVPRIEEFFADRSQHDIFQKELRVILVILLGMVVFFELLGLHSIIAGFFAGLVLSENVSHKELIGKLRAISYGIFIPTFFVVVGTRFDIGVFTQSTEALLLTISIVVGLIISKLVSGYFGSRLAGFTSRQASLFSVSSISKLSTTLAATFTAAELKLIDDSLVSAMIVLSIVTILISPTLIGYLVQSVMRDTDFTHQ